MKKLLFSILAIGMSLTGCTDWEDAVTESYGAGPSISVEVSETADSTFTFTLTPASGTNFYSYVIAEGATAKELDGQTLLKEQYSGLISDVLNTAKNASYTFNMRDEKNKPLCLPNKSYVIYAVAADNNGMVGDVASAVVTTTDGELPILKDYEVAEGDSVAYLAFSEAVALGEGKVSAQYFVEWAASLDEAFVEIAEEDIHVAVSSGVPAVAVSGVPASATVLISWEEGAFVDSKGNKTPAFISGLNSAGDDFEGVVFDMADEPFEITEENVTSPELEASFQKPLEAVFTFTFDMNVYRNERALAGDEIKVTYTHEGKATIVDVPTDCWEVQDNRLMFVLPEAPEYGDWVSVTIAEGTFTDIYGNPNKEVTFEDAWLLSYGYQRDLVVGTYNMNYYSYAAYSQTGNPTEKAVTEKIVIEADPESEDGILMSGFLRMTEKVKGIFNGDFAKIIIEKEQIIGKTTMDGTEYYFTIGGNTDDGSWELDVDANGNLAYNSNAIATGYWYYDTDFNYVGTYDYTIYLEFVKQVAAQRVAPVAGRSVAGPFNIVEHARNKFVK